MAKLLKLSGPQFLHLQNGDGDQGHPLHGIAEEHVNSGVEGCRDSRGITHGPRLFVGKLKTFFLPRGREVQGGRMRVSVGVDPPFETSCLRTVKGASLF